MVEAELGIELDDLNKKGLIKSHHVILTMAVAIKESQLKTTVTYIKKVLDK